MGWNIAESGPASLRDSWPDMGFTKSHEREKGCPARNTGPDGPEDPRCAGTAARVWHRPANRADQRRLARSESGHAVSRPAEAGTGGRHRVRVELLGKQPPRALLSAH